MSKVLEPLEKKNGWQAFDLKYKRQWGSQNSKNPFLATVDELEMKEKGSSYFVGIGLRSVFINAPPKTVVSIVNDPHFFQALFGLDKTSIVEEPKEVNHYQSRVFKLVPGIETQDFILQHDGQWEGDFWIQRAKLVRDEKGFALRDNIKIVEPFEGGSRYREVSLFYPLRWWMRLLNGVVKKETAHQMMQINKTVKCTAEKVASGIPMSQDLAKECHKLAAKN